MAKEKLQVLVIDATTGEQTTRDYTSEEIQTNQFDLEQQEALKAIQESKAQARQSALAKLAALGLTEAEIAAL
jgi:DNA-binding NarL/FixJ family response regulator